MRRSTSAAVSARAANAYAGLALAQPGHVGAHELGRRDAPHVGECRSLRARERCAAARRRDRSTTCAPIGPSSGATQQRVGRAAQSRDEPLVEHDVGAQRDHRAPLAGWLRRVHDPRVTAPGAPQRAQQALLGSQAPDAHAIGRGGRRRAADHPARRCRRELGMRGGHRNGRSYHTLARAELGWGTSRSRSPSSRSDTSRICTRRRVAFWALEPFALQALLWLALVAAAPAPPLSPGRARGAARRSRAHRARPARDHGRSHPDRARSRVRRRRTSWLARFGPPSRVNAIPGNHDAYVAVPSERGWQRWTPYLESDPAAGPFRGDRRTSRPCACAASSRSWACARLSPRRRSCAFGSVGRRAARAPRPRARAAPRRGLCRVVLIHHPPVTGDSSRIAARCTMRTPSAKSSHGAAPSSCCTDTCTAPRSERCRARPGRFPWSAFRRRRTRGRSPSAAPPITSTTSMARAGAADPAPRAPLRSRQRPLHGARSPDGGVDRDERLVKRSGGFSAAFCPGISRSRFVPTSRRCGRCARAGSSDPSWRLRTPGISARALLDADQPRAPVSKPTGVARSRRGMKAIGSRLARAVRPGVPSARRPCSPIATTCAYCARRAKSGMRSPTSAERAPARGAGPGAALTCGSIDLASSGAGSTAGARAPGRRPGKARRSAAQLAARDRVEKDPGCSDPVAIPGSHSIDEASTRVSKRCLSGSSAVAVVAVASRISRWSRVLFGCWRFLPPLPTWPSLRRGRPDPVHRCTAL